MTSNHHTVSSLRSTHRSYPRWRHTGHSDSGEDTAHHALLHTVAPFTLSPPPPPTFEPLLCNLKDLLFLFSSLIFLFSSPLFFTCKVRARGEDLTSLYWRDVLPSILPLHRAISGLNYHGSDVVVKTVVETLHCLGCAIDETDRAGCTALHRALTTCHSRYCSTIQGIYLY